MTYTPIALVTIAAAACCGAVQAQQGSPLYPGQLVRVTAPSANLWREYVTLVGATSDSVVVNRFQLRSDSSSWRTDTIRTALSVRDVQSLEVNRGRRTHVALGVLIGAPFGALVGYDYAKSGEKECGFLDYFCKTPGDPTRGAVIGGLVGLAGGVLVGLAWRTEQWESVPLDGARGLRITVAPLPAGRLGLGAALAF